MVIKPVRISTSTLLVNIIKDVLLEHRLSYSSSFIGKCVELHEALTYRNGVVLYGPSGCGKSTIIRVLGTAWTLLTLELQWGKHRHSERVKNAIEALKEEELLNNVGEGKNKGGLKKSNLRDYEDYKECEDEDFDSSSTSEVCLLVGYKVFIFLCNVEF
jgi:hypothetical protein